MRVLMIGGTGFMGPVAARLLLERGHEVAVFHRGETAHDVPEGVEHLLGERDALLAWRERFLAWAPEVVIHMIAATAQDAWTFARTFEGVAQRAVVASSVDVYRAFDVVRRRSDAHDPGPLREDSPLRDRIYPMREPRMLEGLEGERLRRAEDYDKILVEHLARSSPALPCTILRLPAVFGPHDPRRRLLPWLKRMDDGRDAILLGRGQAAWRWTMGYVEDMAHAIALAATDPRALGRCYNVGEPEALTQRALVERIAARVGWSGSVIEVDDDALPAHLQHADTDYTQPILVDTQRIRRELGYVEQIDPDAALDRTIAWCRANPPAALDEAEYDYAAEDAALAAHGARPEGAAPGR